VNAPQRKGWCPSLMRPMASGDGLLVRIKPPAGRLTVAQAETVANAARAHGNGIIDLTNRGNLQVRGLTDADVPKFAEVVVGCGLAVPDPDAEGARTILVDALGPDDPEARGDSHALGLVIEKQIVETPELHALPGKFGFLVDAGVLMPSFAPATDVEIRSYGGAWRISLDGCAETVLVDTPEAAALAAKRLASAFVSRIAERRGVIRRMRDVAGKRGGPDLFEAAGLSCSETQPPRSPERAPPVGFVAHDGSDIGAFVAAAPFGQIDAERLEGLARLAGEFGDGTLRMTAWKALALTGVAREAAEGLAAQASSMDMVVEANDPRRRIFACAGWPACSSSTVETRADAARIAEIDAEFEGVIHISGCSKGCAHPSPCALTLVGHDGLYDLVRSGRADAAPWLTNQHLSDVVERLRAEARS